MRRKHRVLSIILVIVMITALFGGYIVSNAVTWVDQNDKTEYDNAKAELDRIEREKKELEKELKNLSSEKTSKVKRKVLLEQQLDATNTQIETLEWVIADLDIQLAQTSSELEGIEKEYDECLTRYKGRIRENFESGSLSYLEVLLSSDNFSELLSRLDIINDVLEYDKQQIERLRDLKNEAIEVKDEIEMKRATQLESLRQCEEAREEIEQQKKELDSAIKELESDQEALEAMEIEFERASKELDAQIEKLIDKQRKYAGGDFTWPLPLNYTKITSKFGVERNFILNGKPYHDVHSGVDIAAGKGVEIYAANDGKIIYYKKDSTGSNTCAIDHGSSVVTKYYHMSAFAKNLKVGDEVKKGDLIGYVGMTGYATGNHLHFMVVINGKNVNPLDYVTSDGSKPKKTIDW